MTTLERYKADIKDLVTRGNQLKLAMLCEAFPDRVRELGMSEEKIKELPSFRGEYQKWYSEALACIAQLLPDRVADFVSYYSVERPRKDITHANYTITDYLRGLTVTRTPGNHKVVDPSSAIPAFDQQFGIVEAMERRFGSTLFDIRALVQADLLNDELDAADELNKKGFQRGAGAVAGVTIEAHLAEVCRRHKVKIGKKNPSISDYNDALKGASVLDTVNWRFIQHLADIRNKCDHKKAAEPKKEEVQDLIDGARKISKTVY